MEDDPTSWDLPQGPILTPLKKQCLCATLATPTHRCTTTSRMTIAARNPHAGTLRSTAMATDDYTALQNH
eukprot:364139-Chlamydomonas_euryale.AAC.8